LSSERDSIGYESHSVDETMAVGAAVASIVRSGDLVALIGELGAGKTQFVRGLAGGLNIEPDRVSSPTFVFLQEYDPVDGDADALVVAHVDAYRLLGSDDLASIGWEGDGEELRQGAVLVVEWADRITDALGEDWLEVRLVHNGEGRSITLSPHGDWRDRMPELRSKCESLYP
jgi:tRNA threonylcarbamoyladenosine biosynthesis protein TsaE